MAQTLLTVTALLIPMIPAGLWLRRKMGHGAAAAASSSPAASTQATPHGDARGFRRRLSDAVEHGRASLGLRRLSVLSPEDLKHPWPLEAEERRAGHSERVWYVDGNCTLPGAMDFDAEVVSTGNLRTQPGRRHFALMADGTLNVAPETHIVQWAHADCIDIADGAEIGGTVHAETQLHLAPGVCFHGLDAPVIRTVDRMDRAGTLLVGPARPLTEAEGVYWDTRSQRGHTLAPLQITPLRQWEGDLISRSDLRLGEGCMVRGHVRCHGDLTLQAGCCVEGSLSAYGEIFLSPGCQITGDIQSDALLTIGPGCVIGSPELPVTLRVAQLEMAKGVVLHGRVSIARHWVDWHRRSGTRVRTSAEAAAVPSAATRDILGLNTTAVEGTSGWAMPEWVFGLPASRWQATSAAGVFQAQDARADIQSNHAWEGRLVCPGDLHIAEGCRAIGSIEAAGSVLLEAGTLLMGDISCGQDLRVSGGTQLGGSLRSETAIHLGPGCVVGSAGHPVEIDAPVVTIGLGTVVHGRVCTRGVGGRTLPSVASGTDRLRQANLADAPDAAEAAEQALAA